MHSQAQAEYAAVRTQRAPPESRSCITGWGRMPAPLPPRVRCAGPAAPVAAMAQAPPPPPPSRTHGVRKGCRALAATVALTVVGFWMLFAAAIVLGVLLDGKPAGLLLLPVITSPLGFGCGYLTRRWAMDLNPFVTVEAPDAKSAGVFVPGPWWEEDHPALRAPARADGDP